MLGTQPRGAIHILPSQKKKRESIRNWPGIQVPVYEKLGPEFYPSQPPSYARFDDRDPANHIQVQIRRAPGGEPAVVARARMATPPFILTPQEKPPVKKTVVVSDILLTSHKKAKLVMEKMSGEYFYDALYNVTQMRKKVARFIVKTFETKVKTVLEEAGISPDTLFITDAITCRHHRQRKIRFHGRGKHGIASRDFYRLRFVFAQKPLKEFYKQLLVGRAPPRLCYLIKQKLLRQDADFDQVRQLQFLLHARGRQQQRLMFRRHILKKWVELRRIGNTISYKVLKQKVLEDQAADFEEKYGKLFHDPVQERQRDLEERQQLYLRARPALNG